MRDPQILLRLRLPACPHRLRRLYKHTLYMLENFAQFSGR
jgi:hypothetical protein